MMKMSVGIVVAALALLVLCVRAVPQNDFMVMIPNGSQDLMVSLVESGRDVRGFFGEHVFLFESRKNVFSLIDQFPEAVFVGIGKAQRFAVVEGESSNPQWAALISQVSALPTYRIFFQSQGLLVVGDYATESAEFIQAVTLPFDAEFVSLPEAALVPVMKSAQLAIQQARENLGTRRRNIDALVEAVTEADLREFALYLSGEASNLGSRQSHSTDAVRAGQWALNLFNSYGFNATSDSFGGGYCPNIIAEKRGTTNPENVVIIGAHLDDRNANLNDNTGRAPGANDDGSGSSAILQIAKAIFDVGTTFQSTVRLALWCGEEQGLVGSRSYATRAAATRENIIGMFQADMIGYQAYAYPQCAFVNRYTDNSLTSFTKDVGALYVPEIQQVETSACCSDHQSFYERGFPSAGLVEGGGYTIDPRYHHVEDTVNRSGYSLNQIQSITRILIAAGSMLAKVN